MRIAHALPMPACRQGGLEVLVRTLIASSHPDDTVLLVSEDTAEELSKLPCHNRISGHLQCPPGVIPKAWSDELIQWLIKQEVDICHFHLPGTYGLDSNSLYPIIQTAHSAIPAVVTNHHAMDYFDPYGPQKPFWRKCAATAKRWPGKAHQLSVVRWEASVSMHDLEVNRRYFPHFESKLIQLYHSRLDADLVVTPPPSSKVILNVGTVAFHKGQHLLVEAFAQIAGNFQDWCLNLVGYCGDKACVDQIHSLIQEHSLQNQVILHGSHQDPDLFYRNCEIYVQPSLKEGLGLSLQEAMFHGRACIGSAIGGIPELINAPETNGLLYASGDIPALSAALSQLMVDSNLRSKLGIAARQSIMDRGMTRQAMSVTYRDLYQKAILSR